MLNTNPPPWLANLSSNSIEWRRWLNYVYTKAIQNVSFTSGNYPQFDDIGNLSDSGTSAADIETLLTQLAFYPYVIDWQAPPVTSTLTVDFYAINVVFSGKLIPITAWSHTFTANKITWVQIDSSGSIYYQEEDPTAYTSFTRDPTKLLLAEVTTGSTKVVAIYYRANSRWISYTSLPRPLNGSEYYMNYYIKPHTGAWPSTTAPLWEASAAYTASYEVWDGGSYVWTSQGAGTSGTTISWPTSPTVGTTTVTDNTITWLCTASAGSVSYLDVLNTSNNDLYLVVNSGLLTFVEPTIPVYEYEYNVGFREQTNGTAVVVYIGKEAYEGAWKPAYYTAINWYFSTLGVGWLAKSGSSIATAMGTELLNHIRTAVNRAVNPWQASFSYYQWMLVVDTSTGYIWQAQTAGTSGSTVTWDVGYSTSVWTATTSYALDDIFQDSNNYVWTAQNAGTSGSSISIPASPTVGTTTITDNTITWLCTSLQSSPIIGTTQTTDGGVTWTCFGLTNPNAIWQLVDTNVTQDQFKSPDSHDSYAAVLIWALEQIRSAGLLPTSFWTETSQNGTAYVEDIRNIIYNNIILYETNNLSSTFQNSIVPDGSGSTYDIQFLMDNCEVYAGLSAAYDFYSDSNYTTDTSYPSYVQGHMNTILTGINSLWDGSYGTYGAWKYYLGYDLTTTPTDPLFYPWIMAQAWPGLWDIPVDYYKLRNSMYYTIEQYNDWWQTNEIDDLSALGAHIGFYKMFRTKKIRNQILERVETEKMFLSTSELYLHDLGYYTWLRMNGDDSE